MVPIRLYVPCDMMKVKKGDTEETMSICLKLCVLKILLLRLNLMGKSWHCFQSTNWGFDMIWSDN